MKTKLTAALTLIVLFCLLLRPAWSTDCNEITDCYGVANAGIGVFLAILGVILLVFLPQIAAALLSAVATAAVRRVLATSIGWIAKNVTGRVSPWVNRILESSWVSRFFKSKPGTLANTTSKRLSDTKAKSIKSLEQLIQNHRQKLDDYKRNPDKYDNKGVLRNAKDQATRDKIIRGRINKLEKEINKFQNEIDKVYDKIKE